MYNNFEKKKRRLFTNSDVCISVGKLASHCVNVATWSACYVARYRPPSPPPPPHAHCPALAPLSSCSFCSAVPPNWLICAQ